MEVNSVSPLRRLRDELFLEEVPPELRASAAYNFDERRIIINFSESGIGPSGGPLAVNFTGSVNREVLGEGVDDQRSFIKSALEAWRKDVDDFHRIALRFHSMYGREEV